MLKVLAGHYCFIQPNDHISVYKIFPDIQLVFFTDCYWFIKKVSPNCNASLFFHLKCLHICHNSVTISLYVRQSPHSGYHTHSRGFRIVSSIPIKSPKNETFLISVFVFVQVFLVVLVVVLIVVLLDPIGSQYIRGFVTQ